MHHRQKRAGKAHPPMQCVCRMSSCCEDVKKPSASKSLQHGTAEAGGHQQLRSARQPHHDGIEQILAPKQKAGIELVKPRPHPLCSHHDAGWVA